MTWDLALEILGFCVGLLYLWYEYHASWRMWIVSVIMPAISMWIYILMGYYLRASESLMELRTNVLFQMLNLTGC